MMAGIALLEAFISVEVSALGDTHDPSLFSGRTRFRMEAKLV